jgi:cytochrome o ubiquinol oxidase subunit 1
VQNYTPVVVPTALIYYSFLLDTTKIIPAKQVEREYKAWLAEVANATPVTREDETKSVNTGLEATKCARPMQNSGL